MINEDELQCATGEEQRAITNSSRKKEEARSKWKQRSAVDVSSGESQVWCCKEQYCIGTWNVKAMNQGKLDVVTHEMARVNINILGISELKWMGELNSDDHFIYYCGQESLRRNGIALTVNERDWNTIIPYNLKNDRMISVHFQGKPFNIAIIQVYNSTIDWFNRSWSWLVQWIPKHLLELKPKKISYSS